MVDHDKWGAGPWKNEPDTLSWEDPGTGMPCYICRDDQLGFLCAYIGVPETHPWHRKCYSEKIPGLTHITSDDVPIDEVGIINYYGAGPDEIRAGTWPISLLIRCHGGISYAGEGFWDDDRATWWFGFDCCHAGDIIPVFTNDPPHHANAEYRDINYVQRTCAKACQDIAKGAIRIVNNVA